MPKLFPDNPYYMDPNIESIPKHLQKFDYDNNWAIWPVIILSILGYLILSEIGSQDCTTQNCNNKLPEILETDTKIQIIDKISQGLRKNHRTVTWRIAFISAIIISLLIVLIFYKDDMISGLIMLILILIVFFAVAFSFTWFNAHFHRQNSYKEELVLQELRHKVQQDNTKPKSQNYDPSLFFII